MKNNALLISLTLWCAVITAGCGGGTPSGKVLVDINGSKITEGDLEFLGKINPRIKAQISNPAGKKRLLDNLVEQDLFYQEAVKKGVNRDSEVKAKVDLYRRVIIAQSLVDKEIEDAAKKYYDATQDEFKKLKLSHIMVKFGTPDEIKKAKKGEKLHSEEEALKIIKQLKEKADKGTEFAKVAEEGSEDVATKNRGGDLGLASKDDKRLDSRGFAPLLEKAFAMKVGEVSEPIKTAKGYHIITVTRGVELEPYEEAKEQIMFKVRGDTRDKLLAKLKKDAEIVYPEEEEKKKEAAKKAEEAKQAGKEKPTGETTTNDEKKGGEGEEGETKKVDVKPGPESKPAEKKDASASVKKK